MFHSDKTIQDEKINSLENNQKANNETLNQLLGKIEDILLTLSKMNSKIDFLSNKVNDLNATLVNYNIKKKQIYSLAQNVLITEMKSQGYEIVYDYPYSHPTTINELNVIRLNCLSETILCAGGAAKGSYNLLLISCGNCRSILTATSKNNPVLNNGAFWYFKSSYSFGLPLIGI